ncbi:hypothetical protein Godav_022028, partial [Gossypium davidsonii]|nr:hypothetical protein [Gossypium davidsonii]
RPRIQLKGKAIPAYISELNLLPKLVVISLDISSKHLVDGFVFQIVKSVDACKQLFEDVESLQLNAVEGHPNLIPSIDLGFNVQCSPAARFFRKLEEVIVSDCGEMQVLYPIAELRSIEQEGPSRHLSLQSLKIVEIEGCNNLKYIFPISTAKAVAYFEDKELLVSLIDLPQLKKTDVNNILLTQSSLQKLEVTTAE